MSRLSSSGLIPGPGQIIVGGPGGVPQKRDPQLLDIRDFGGVDDGTTANDTAFAAALAAASSTGRRTILLPRTTAGRYRVTSTIQTALGGLAFIGTGGWRPADVGGVVIEFAGTGPLFQLGTDDGLAWDRAGYDGTAELFTLRDLHVLHVATDTALDNGLGNYKAGSYVVQDWRSGALHWHNVGIENFDYPFWGVQSDISEFSNVRLFYTHHGFFFGPRSDQTTMHRPYAYGCDVSLMVDSAQQLRVRDGQFVGCGSATSAGIVLTRSSSSVGATMQVIFDDCWFEHYQGAATIPAHIDVGVGSANQVASVIIRNPYILNNPSGGGTRAQYFIRAGNANKIVVSHPNQSVMANFDAFAASSGTQTVDLALEGHLDLQPYATVAALSTGSIRIAGMFTSNVTRFQNTNGRLYYGTGGTKDLYLASAFNDKWFEVFQPGIATGQTGIVSLRNRLVTLTAAPTTGTWDVGDKVLNQTPSETGTAGSKYVVLGWVCTVAGTPGTWLPMRVLTGN